MSRINPLSKLVVVTMILVSGPVAQADDDRWSTAGPYDGRIQTIAIDPHNNQHIYIGTIENGIYQTTDGGASWQRIEDDTLDTCMRDIVIDPAAPDTMYSATVRGMYKSVNAGRSWSLMRPPGYWFNQISDLEIHLVHHNIVFAGGNTNCKSTDRGNTWEELVLPWVFVVAIRTDPLRSDTIYLATQSADSGMSVFRSEDLGETWYSVHNNLDSSVWGWDLAIDPVNSNVIYFGGHDRDEASHKSLFKSTDAGSHWMDITPPGLRRPAVLSITISPFNHRTVYVCTESNGVLKSTDEGQSWREVNVGVRGHAAAEVVADTISGLLYLGTYYDGIYKSTDGGETWQKISQNIPEANCFNMAVNPRCADSLYVTTMNGLYRSVDGARSWQPVNLAFPFHDPTTFGIAVDQYDPRYVYVSYDSWTRSGQPGIYRTTDGGDSWNAFWNGLPDSTPALYLDVASWPDGRRRIFVASYGLFYSDDLGETWLQCHGGLPEPTWFWWVECSRADPMLVYVADWFLQGYSSSDGGATWVHFHGPPACDSLDEIICDPIDPAVVYVCKYKVGVFRTSDGGTTWSDITNDLPRYPPYFITSGLAINPLNPSELYVNSFRYGMFASYDCGQHWQPFNAGLNIRYVYATTVVAPSDTNRIFLATGEHSVWSFTKTTSSVDENSNLPRQFVLFPNYPNPFNSSTILTYRLGQAGPVVLSVYNVMGQLVETLWQGETEAGEHQMRWHPGDLSSGIYFGQLVSKAGEQTTKMLLIK